MTVLRIGHATLYLARCETILPFIGPVDAMVTDIPYNFKTSGGGKWRKKRRVMEDIEEAGLSKGFDINIINPALYRSIFMFCHNDQLHQILPWFAKNYRRHAVLNWEKLNPMPMANKHYVPQLEYYIHAWNKGGHPAGELKDKMRSVKTAVGKSIYDHPTVKPLEVMRKILKNVNGGTVIDPLMGTGSTGIAALEAGKKFIGIEHNPKFFNIACERLAGYYAGVSAPVGL